jgi:putative transcriptional regulator
VVLDDIKARAPAIDRRKIEATTEADIARHALEDGEHPGREAVGYVERKRRAEPPPGPRLPASRRPP